MKTKDLKSIVQRLAGTTRGIWLEGQLPMTVIAQGLRPAAVTDEILERYGGVPVASDISEGDADFMIHARSDIVMLIAEVKRLNEVLRIVGATDPDAPDEFDDSFEAFYNEHLQRQYTPTDDKDIEIVELKREVKRLQNLLDCFDDSLEEDVMAAIKGLEQTVRLKFERAREADSSGGPRPAWTGHAKR